MQSATLYFQSFSPDNTSRRQMSLLFAQDQAKAELVTSSNEKLQLQKLLVATYCPKILGRATCIRNVNAESLNIGMGGETLLGAILQFLKNTQRYLLLK